MKKDSRGTTEFKPKLEEMVDKHRVSNASRGKPKRDGLTLGEISGWEPKELRKDSVDRL
jgi:hypothetical protein